MLDRLFPEVLDGTPPHPPPPPLPTPGFKTPEIRGCTAASGRILRKPEAPLRRSSKLGFARVRVGWWSTCTVQRDR